jgi:predicted nucleic acid-binding protein
VNRFVLDASVALGWFLDQPTPDLAVRIRESLLAGDSTAIVPSFWHLEIANVLVVAERRGLTSIQDVDTFIAYLEGLLVSAIESRSEPTPVRAAVEFARQYELTPYDAVYLALAQEEGIALATLDQKLRAAATRAGVHVVR